MTQPHSTLRLRQDDRALTFRAEGRACMAQGLAMRRCAEKGLADGTAELRVDLGNCTYMDSTFIGTLLYLRQILGRRGLGELTLVAPSTACRDLLSQLGVEDVFPVMAAESGGSADWTEVCSDLGDPASFNRGVVQAHQELAGLPGPAGDPFRAVMRTLAKEEPAQPAR